jgi:hypothetical protein
MVKTETHIKSVVTWHPAGCSEGRSLTVEIDDLGRAMAHSNFRSKEVDIGELPQELFQAVVDAARKLSR